MEQVMECTLIKFAGDIKVGGPLHNLCHSQECRGLGKWANRNLPKFSKDKYQILHLEEGDPYNDTGWDLTVWGAAQLRRTWAGSGRWQSGHGPAVCPSSKDQEQPGLY